MNSPGSNKSAVRHIESQYDKEFVLVSDFDAFELKKTPLYDALILDYTDKEGCIRTLKNIRASGIESIYLVPVFILSIVDLKDPEINELVDGVINSIEPDAINSYVESVRNKRRRLMPFNITPDIDKHLLKLLRFVYTRERKVTPVKDRHSLIGYKYPLLHLSIGEQGAKSEIKSVTKAIEEGFFKPDFVNRMHLCGKCNGGFLNYKEIDPETGSSHLETENLIHHFSCAYVGPESDFSREDKFICPKCNKTLRHIGVDYDKPSVMYHAVDHDRYFQNPEMKAECLNCGHMNDIESLQQYDLFELEITEEGRDEAIQPRGTQSTKDTVYSGFITYSTFGTFLKYEIERVKTSQRESSIGLIRLGINSEIEHELGNRYDKLIEEISAYISNNSSGSQVLSRSVNSFFILTPETPLDKCQKNIEKLKSSITELLKNNVKDIDIDVHSATREITATSEYQNVLNDLRAGILKD